MEKKFVVLEKYGKRREYSAMGWFVCGSVSEAKTYIETQSKQFQGSGEFYESLIIRTRVFD